MRLSDINLKTFKQKALQWAAKNHDVFVILDSNGINSARNYDSYEFVLAAGIKSVLSADVHEQPFEKLKAFINKTWAFGYLTYDLKNTLEELHSHHFSGNQFPPLFFFEPLHLILVDREFNITATIDVMDKIMSQDVSETLSALPPIEIKARVSKEEYLNKVDKIQHHILEGDVYELNYCMEFYAEDVQLNPYEVYEKLKSVSPTPFGAFMKLNNQYLICASPERFMRKQNDKIIGQPIKGTAARNEDEQIDEYNKKELLQSEKERAENLMIVDLVRNDFARSSQIGTVNVEELFGIYSFKSVHPMISTVTAIVRNDCNNATCIQNAFPMGSMTGAPKIKAMQLIEEYERTKRTIYSGALGYFTPDNQFDLNVVIRSMVYNAQTGYLSFEVGSAITYDSIAEKEYEECLLKAKAMMNVFSL
jgi:para-aminobenzoate synthetase component 1